MFRKGIKTIFGLIIFFMFTGCLRGKNRLQFSFEEINNYYTDKLERSFLYIPDIIFPEIEEELNELIKNSKYCSVLIKEGIGNGIYSIAAIYDSHNEIYFYERDIFKGIQIVNNKKIQNQNAKKILMSKPQDEFISDIDTFLLDGISYYVIKKIKEETYYYSSYGSPVDEQYEELIRLFRNSY